MISKGLLVRFQSRAGKQAEVEQFLSSALPMVREETDTQAWFALNFGGGGYGIVDVFPDDASRENHLRGPVATALMEKTGDLLAALPQIHRFDVLAAKVPGSAPAHVDTKGLLLTFMAQENRGSAAEEFLRRAQPLVEQEPETTAWFGIHLDDGKYGVFDVFPNAGGRLKHLMGRVPRAMAMKAPRLFGGMPNMDMVNVVAEMHTGEIGPAGW